MKSPYRISKELFTEELKQEFDNKVSTDTGTLDWEQITNKPQFSDGHWRSPIATFAELPMTGNSEEDIRLVLETSEVYTWDVDTWVLIGANDTNVEWVHLQNKPLTFPPDPHAHTFASITEKPETYPPSEHTHPDSHTHINKTVLDEVSSEDVTLWNTVSNKAEQSDLANKADNAHLHDGRYHTQAQITSLLSNKSDNTHTHSTYTHNQVSAIEVWTITHNLGKYPSVTVVDSADTVVIGDVVYLTNNQIQLTFSAAFSGKAYLN